MLTVPCRLLLKYEEVLNSSQLQTSTYANSMDSEETVTLQLTDRLSVRLYKDCRPNCLETAQLQKGLVLMLDGRELIEEGIGFGVPVVKYGDKTYFSSSAQVSTDKIGGTSLIKKVYLMDTISRKKFWRARYIDDNLYSKWRKIFEKSYLKHKQFTVIFNRIMELREIAKIKTEFVKVKPRGTIIVYYQFQPTNINVNVNFKDLTLHGCEELLVLNEQGSTFFAHYADTGGAQLLGSKIGAWDKVNAETATMQNDEVTFSLKNVYGGLLFRGWERTRKRFSWAGLSYSLSPNNGTFTYTINLNLNLKSQSRLAGTKRLNP